jgi:hypothetical protein
VVVDLRLRGTLSLTALDGQGTILASQFEGELDNAHSADHSLAEAWRPIENSFRQGFWIEFGSDGRCRGLRFSPDTAALVEQVWHDVAATLQLSAHGGRTAWQASEDDNIGTYLARYQLGDSPGEIRRHKESYSKVKTSAAVQYEIKSSTAEFRLDKAGEMQALRSTEQIAVRADKPLPSFDTSTQLALDLVRAGPAVPGVAARLAVAMTQKVSMPGPKLAAGVRREIDDARVGGRSLSSVLGLLTELEGLAATRPLTSEEQERAGRASIALSALIRTQPEVLTEIGQHLRDRGPLTDVLIEALRAAATPEAQTLLRAALSFSKLDHPNRMELARALSRVDGPTPETVKSLEALQTDPALGAQATYGLGSNAYRLRESDPKAAQAIVAKLVRQLKDAASDGERAMFLTSLGNAGSPEALSAIKTYLASESELERVAAARALRRATGDAADQMLAAASADSSARVRMSVFDAISEHAPTAALVAVVQRAALADAAYGVRMGAVRTAAGWANRYPALVATLEQVTHSDPHDDVRRTAQAALDAYRETHR